MSSAQQARRGAEGLGPDASTAPADAQQQQMENLWSLYCSSLVGSVSHTDAVVNDIWNLFYPLLSHVTLLPLASTASHCLGGSSSTSRGAPPLTHIFYVDLRDPASVTEEEAGHSAAPVTPQMCGALTEQPHIVLPLLEFFMAVIQLRGQGASSAARSGVGDDSGGGASTPPDRVYCCVLGNTTAATPFANLGAAQLGRLVTVRGTLVRLSPTRIACVHMTYRCGVCGAAKEVATENGVLVYPTTCVARCRGYKWAPLLDTGVCEEVQLLKLQEQTYVFDTSTEAGGGGGGGGVNKVLEVELRAPLLDQATVGDAVCVCGVLTTQRGERKSGCAQQICLHARSIVGTRQQLARLHVSTRAAEKDSLSGISGDWTPEESGRYYEMARNPRWFARLAASVAPSLYGLERVKEAILLAVVGGSTQKLGARSSIHLLLVGDPGLGKSQLLRAACGVASRSAFVCAHTSSACGLTMTLSRDPVSGEATFEAGAVVHGDGGVTCIDEIDKGAAEHKALLEVMEQETVSIAKAGMVFSMPVHTSLLAAGNPVGGRFDLTKPISANLNLSPALLNRFDIVVCLRDPHTTRTGQLTTHVLQLHRGKQQQSAQQPGTGVGGVLPTALVRRFVQFCRMQCQPSLCDAACVLLKEHYLAERAKLSAGAEVPVTPRYLQALIRVAEARAKVELRHEVSVDDAAYAVQLLQDCVSSFRDVADGGAGVGSGNVGVSGKARKKNQQEVVVDLLKAEVVRSGGVNRLGYNTILTICEEAGCKNPAAMLRQLNEFGVLLQRGDVYTLRGV